MKQTLVTICATLLLAANAWAADLERELKFEIPSQPLAAALLQFSTQANIQILTAGNEISAAQSPGVNVRCSIESGLKKLLAGTGFIFRPSGENTVSIVRQDHAGAALPDAAGMRLVQADQPSPSKAEKQDEDEKDFSSAKGIPEILVKGSRSLNADIQRLADDVRPYVVLDRQKIEKSSARDVNEFLRQELPMQYEQVSNDHSFGSEGGSIGKLAGNSSTVSLNGLSSRETLILIDGRRSTMLANDQIQPEAQSDLNGIPLAAVERIEVLPMSASGIYGGNATGGVINVILRRDYTGIETSLHYRSTFAGGGASRGLDIFSGFTLGTKTSVQVSGSYSRTAPLLAGDVGFYEKYRKRRQEDLLNSGRADAVNTSRELYLNAGNPPLGATTNISSTRQFTTVPDGTPGATCIPNAFCYLFVTQNLTLKPQFGGNSLNTTITSLPVGYAGIQSDSAQALVDRAGRYNLDLVQSNQAEDANFGAGHELMGAPVVGSFNVTLRTEWTPRFGSYLEVGGARNESHFDAEYPATIFTLPASSSANPFEQDIRIAAPLLTRRAYTQTSRADSGSILLGGNLQLGGDWSSQLEYKYSIRKARDSEPRAQYLSIANDALASGDLNLLQDPNRYTDLVLSDYLTSALATTTTVNPQRSRLGIATLRLAGPLFSLPAGQTKLSAMAEASDQHYSPFEYQKIEADGSLTWFTATAAYSRTQSAYAEATVPLVSNTASLLGIHSAELQIAGRYDRYDLKAKKFVSQFFPNAIPASTQVFSKTVPSIGLRVQPIQDLIFRVNYNEGFLPPYLGQLQDSVSYFLPVADLSDPKRSNSPAGLNNRLDSNGLPLEHNGEVEITSVANSQLTPELSRSWAAGVILTPRWVSDLRLSFDWIRIRKKDNIFFLQSSNQEFLSLGREDVFPGTVTRGPLTLQDQALGYTGGPILAFDNSNRNGLQALSELYNVAFDYTLPMQNIGRWTFAAAATRLIHSSHKDTLDTPVIEDADTGSRPEWNGNVSLAWDWRQLSVSLKARYLGGFRVTNQPTSDVGREFMLIYGGTRIPSTALYDFSAQYSGLAFGSGTTLGSLLSDVRVSLGIKNIFDTAPRYAAFTVSGIPYVLAGDDTAGISYLLRLQASF